MKERVKYKGLIALMVVFALTAGVGAVFLGLAIVEAFQQQARIYYGLSPAPLPPFLSSSAGQGMILFVGGFALFLATYCVRYTRLRKDWLEGKGEMPI